MIWQNDQINDLNEDTGAIALVSKPTNGLFLQRWFREADRRIPTTLLGEQGQWRRHNDNNEDESYRASLVASAFMICQVRLSAREVLCQRPICNTRTT